MTAYVLRRCLNTVIDALVERAVIECCRLCIVVDDKRIVDEDLPDTVRSTQTLFDRGLEVEAIAAKRGLDAATVVGHLEALLAHGAAIDLSRLIAHDRVKVIVAALEKHGDVRLKPAYEALGGDYRYEDLRLVRAWLHGRRTPG